MKLRILNNAIRLRLSQSDIKTLQSKSIVSGHTSFLDSSFTYSLLVNSTEADVSAKFLNNKLTIEVSTLIVNNWISDEDAEGFENQDQSLHQIQVEKDFQCLHKRPGENEADNFPNPLASSMEE